MAATFVEVTLDDMDRFLKRSYRALKPHRGDARGEVYYDLNLSDGKILIRVWTSIHPRSGVGAEAGSDAIRVTMITSGGRALMPKGKIVKRTLNWRNALQDRIEELHEVYESQSEYWKTRRRERDGDTPEPVQERNVFHLPEPVHRPAPAPVEPKPPTPSGEMAEGAYRKLKNGIDWGVQIWTRGTQGDIVMAKTKGGKKTRVKLNERDQFGPDRYKNGEYMEIWSFTDPSGHKLASIDGEDFLGSMAQSVAERYLNRSV